MSEVAPAMIEVDVAYALPQRQWLLRVALPAGSTVADAVERSGIRAQVAQYLGVDAVEESGFGVFGQAVTPETALRAGDRVEIYRPLQCDPKQVRRERAARQPLRRRPTDARRD